MALLPVRARDDVVIDDLADRHAVDTKPLAIAEVGLDERADREPAVAFLDHPRRGPDPALELERDRAGAATDVAFGDGTAGRRVERSAHVFGADVEAVDVVHVAVEDLAHHRQEPP